MKKEFFSIKIEHLLPPSCPRYGEEYHQARRKIKENQLKEIKKALANGANPNSCFVVDEEEHFILSKEEYREAPLMWYALRADELWCGHEANHAKYYALEEKELAVVPTLLEAKANPNILIPAISYSYSPSPCYRIIGALATPLELLISSTASIMSGEKESLYYFNTLKTLIKAGADVNASGWSFPLLEKIRTLGFLKYYLTLKEFLKAGLDLNTMEGDHSRYEKMIQEVDNAIFLGNFFISKLSSFDPDTYLNASIRRLVKKFKVEPHSDIPKVHAAVIISQLLLFVPKSLAYIILDYLPPNDAPCGAVALDENSSPEEFLKTNASTPLERAVYYGYPHVVEQLLEAKADVTVQNKEGLTPIEFGRSRFDPYSSEAVTIIARHLYAKFSLFQAQEKAKKVEAAYSAPAPV